MVWRKENSLSPPLTQSVLMEITLPQRYCILAVGFPAVRVQWSLLAATAASSDHTKNKQKEKHQQASYTNVQAACPYMDRNSLGSRWTGPNFNLSMVGLIGKLWSNLTTVLKWGGLKSWNIPYLLCGYPSQWGNTNMLKTQKYLEKIKYF